MSAGATEKTDLSVCEWHDDRPWDGENACGYGGAGMPCPSSPAALAHEGAAARDLAHRGTPLAPHRINDDQRAARATHDVAGRHVHRSPLRSAWQLERMSFGPVQ